MPRIRRNRDPARLRRMFVRTTPHRLAFLLFHRLRWRLYLFSRKDRPLGGCVESEGVSEYRAMSVSKTKPAKTTRTGKKARTEPPWNVMLHNDWENSMPKVVLILKKTIPGMSYKRAVRIMYEAHSQGPAVVKRCHKELAELYKELLQKEGLTVSIEPAR